MAVRKRGNRWQADVTVKGKRLPRYSFATEDAAKAWEMEAKAAALVGKPIPIPDAIAPATSTGGRRRVENWTLGQILDETWDEVWSKQRGNKPVSYNIEGIRKFFGADLPIHEIDYDMLVDFKDHLYDLGNTGATVNRKLSALSRAMTLAMDKGILTHKPKFPRQPEGKGRIRFLSDHEEGAFHHYFRLWSMEDRLDAFIILIDTGFRPSELWRLEPRDVSLRTGTITLWETKTDTPRSVSMTKRVKQVIERRLAEHGGFFDWGLSMAQMNRWFRKGWNMVRDQLGLEDDPFFVPYILRHTCCSRLVQNGAELLFVKQWMGHKHIQTTERYAHLSPKHVHRLSKLLEPQLPAE